MKAIAFWPHLGNKREMIEPQSRQANLPPSPWKRLEHKLTELAIAIIRQEPRISQYVDRNGEVWWEVYIPTTKQTHWFASENELRIWLDQHYF